MFLLFYSFLTNILKISRASQLCLELPLVWLSNARTGGTLAFYPCESENNACGMDGLESNRWTFRCWSISYQSSDFYPSRSSMIIIPLRMINSWKSSFVHFIEKPGGSGVRPISLNSCTCKLYETLIKNRIKWWVETCDLLPESQCGFRKSRFCVDNSACLTSKMNESFCESLCRLPWHQRRFWHRQLGNSPGYICWYGFPW